MADPTLDQMIAAQESRRTPHSLGFLDLLRQLVYPNRKAPINQPFGQFDEQGNPLPPRTINDVLSPRR